MSINKKGFSFGTFIKYFILIFLVVFEIFPLLMVLFNTFRPDEAIQVHPFGLPDFTYWENWPKTWKIGGYGQAYINTIIVAAMTIVMLLVVDGFASYALAKMKIRRKELFNGYFFVALAIPSFLFIIPVYSVFNKIGLVNTHFGLALVLTATEIPFNLILLRTFLLGIPHELEEAAKIDGCTEIQSFWHITVPLAKSIFLTVALLTFCKVWNEYLFSNTFITSDALRTVGTRYVRFTGKYSSNMAHIYTSSFFTIFPVIVLYAAFSRKFIEGISVGAVKG